MQVKPRLSVTHNVSPRRNIIEENVVTTSQGRLDDDEPNQVESTEPVDPLLVWRNIHGLGQGDEHRGGRNGTENKALIIADL